MKFSLIIPAKNEEKRIILPLLDYYVTLLRKFGPHRFEILVIINNTTDNTVLQLQRLKKALRCTELRIYDVGKTNGKGESILYGIRKAKGKILGFVDADGSSSGRELLKMYRTLATGQSTDVVLASRYMKGGQIVGKRPLSRTIASSVLHKLIRILFKTPYRDFFCGLKLFRRNTINTLLVNTTAFGWGFDISFIISLVAAGFSVVEKPTEWSDKAQSNVNLIRNTPKLLSELFKVHDTYRAIAKSQGKRYTMQNAA